MAHDTQWYIDETAGLIERDAELRAVQAAYDRIGHLEYSLPASLSRLQWMRAYRTTAPYDALRGATRALSGLEEQLQIEPVSVLKAVRAGYDDDSAEARKIANSWETALRWNMRRAASRAAIFRPDLIRSALLYDEICCQVVHLPTQIKAHAKLGGSTQRYKAALAHGPFAVLIRNPQTVHVRYSDYMAEAVVSVTVQTPRAIVDVWGAAARAVSRKIDDGKAPDSYLLVDYCDRDSRCVWAVPGDDETSIAQYQPDHAEFIEIVRPSAQDYPFLNWVCVVGGTNLDAAQEHRRQPLFYPIYQSELWLNANLTGSLGESMAVATAAQPSLQRAGPDPSSIEIEYDTPGGTIDTTPGHDVKKLPKDGLDPAMFQLLDRHISEIDRATVSKVLVTAETQPGETFAGYNLRVQTAIGSLIPFKALGERALEGIYTLMLLWAEATGTDIVGYGTGRDERGKKYTIDSGDIDPDGLYLKVSLQPDVPVDRLQKINGAIAMAQQLKVSSRYVLEEIGVNDPDREMDRYVAEQIRWALVSARLQRVQMEASGQIEQMAQQRAQQMLEQQAQQQPPGPQMSPEQAGMFGQMANPENLLGGNGLGPMAQGQLNNPALGGNPAAMLNPNGATREAQTGLTRAGTEI